MVLRIQCALAVRMVRKLLHFYNISTKDKICCLQDTSLETLRQNQVPGFSCLVLTVCLHHHTVPEMICTPRTPPQSADEDHTYGEVYDSSGLDVKDLWNGETWQTLSWNSKEKADALDRE